MELAPILALLNQQIGIAPHILGDRKLTKAVESRRLACRAADAATYLRLLQTSPQEMEQLVEQVVVPETWFFRDRKPFDFLVEFVRSEWLQKPNPTKLRVLSAPCSTGEEVYSIAIALLEAGLSEQQFRVEGIDISHLALAKAQQGIYGKNSFRGEDWCDRRRYFQPVQDRYQDRYEVLPQVRRSVTFRRCNLLDPAFGQAASRYDIIFCRNLLIYLEDAACHQILNTMYELLSWNGLLFVGGAETAKVPRDRFVFLRHSFTFAYRKLPPQLHPPLTRNPKPPSSDIPLLTSINRALSVPRSPIQSSPIKSLPIQSSEIKTTNIKPSNLPQTSIKHPTKSRLPAAPNIQTRPDQTTPVQSTAAADLQQAKTLADMGQLAAAITQCQAYLARDSTNPDAYALLGTLYQASADHQQAEHCFKKALYLHPTHYEALMQLALLKESQGDAIAAARLQQRIQKLL